METDLDLGHYERFTGIRTTRANSVTTGRIYRTVIDKERHGDYLGKTIQVVPHITDEIKRRMLRDDDVDFVITEIGGTIGDIESAPFLEAIRQLKWELGNRAVSVHLTYVPYLRAADELKTKPTQHSVKEMQGAGIQPDVLVLRTEKHLSDGIRQKVASFCTSIWSAWCRARTCRVSTKCPSTCRSRDWMRRYCGSSVFPWARPPRWRAGTGSWTSNAPPKRKSA